MMNNIYDIVEICLQELESGADMEKLLSRYPEHADELRPILQASIRAKGMSVPGPSADAVHRSRAKVMQRAAELRERKPVVLPWFRRSSIGRHANVIQGKRQIPAFQRMAMSLGLTAIFLLSGTGLVRASSTSLPGENLYPVKRTWEDLQLILTFNTQTRQLLEDEFELERLEETHELIAEGRHETIEFAGVFMVVNGQAYISGIPVVLPTTIQAPANGSPVIVSGRTNAQGFVELESLEVLPDGTMVPVGSPMEVDTEDQSNVVPSQGGESGSGADGEAQESIQKPEKDTSRFKMEGTISSLSNGTVIVNGKSMILDGAEIRGQLVPGARVEVEGYYLPNGQFVVTRIEVEDANSDGDSESSISNSNDGGDDNTNDSNDNSGSGDDDSNDNSESGDDSNDDHSGSGNGD